MESNYEVPKSDKDIPTGNLSLSGLHGPPSSLIFVHKGIVERISLDVIGDGLDVRWEPNRNVT